MKCVLLKMKESWTLKGLPLKKRDTDIVQVFAKVKERLQKLKKNIKTMKADTRERHSERLSSTTVNIGPGNYKEVIKSN